MMLFWAIAAMMLIGALCLVLPPLARRASDRVGSVDRAVPLESVEVYRQLKHELDTELASGAIDAARHADALRALEVRMVEELTPPSANLVGSARSGKVAAVSLAVALPLAAVSLYLLLGNPDGLSPQLATAESHHSVTPEQIVAMVERLATRMEQNPDDAEGWSMLARSYAALERYQDAVPAYEKALALMPNDAQLRADLADILGVLQGKDLSGRPDELIRVALQLDPNNQKALALAGTAAFNRKDYRLAIEYWQRLLDGLPQGSDPARSVADSIAEAQAGLGTVPRSATTESPAAARPAAKIAGQVDLAPHLAGKVSPGDVLFIYARAIDGPKMPLAVMRVAAKDFPQAFSLDESMAMSPAFTLAKFPQVAIVARISKSGSANPQRGDLESTPLTAAVGGSNLRLAIDREVP